MSNAKHTTYVSFCSRISPESIESLLSVCTRLANEGSAKVYLMLSSPGGAVESAIAAYNILRGMPFELVTHNVGRVDSMGNVLFLAGDRRFACATSSFMFHGVGFNVSAGARFEMKNLREKMDSVGWDQRKIAAIMAQRTRLEPARIERMFEEAVTRDPDFALEHGIIDEVREVTIPGGAPVVLVERKGPSRQG